MIIGEVLKYNGQFCKHAEVDRIQIEHHHGDVHILCIRLFEWFP